MSDPIIINTEKLIRGASGDGGDLELGETASTAYRGDRGKLAYDHSQTPHAPTDAEPNNVTDADAFELTAGTDSDLHYHSADRDRSNHTGTQTADTISDFADYVKDLVAFICTCETAAATVAKVIVCGDGTRLPKAGELYAIKFTLGNTVAAPTVALNGDAARNLRLNGIDVNTTVFTLAANASVLTLFDGTYYNVLGSQRTSDSDYYDRMQFNAAIVVGVPVYDYKILMQGPDYKFYPLTLEEGTGTTKTISTQEFLLGTPILYYSSTTHLAADGTTTSVYLEYGTSNIEYTANVPSFTTQKPVYLKGTIVGDGHFKLDNTSYTSFMTQDLPTTDDGFVYIYLGFMYSGGDNIRITQSHPIYQYKDGKVRLYIPEHTHSVYATVDDPTFTGTPQTPTPVIGADPTQIANVEYVLEAVSSAGGGDMMKSVYDQDGDGIVDDSEKLGGVLASAYARKINGATVRTYKDVADYSFNGGDVTGIIKIKLPKSWSSTMLIFEIDVFDYSTNSGGKILVSGYNYSDAGNFWVNPCVTVLGTLRNSYVRLAHDGTSCCILIGKTTSVWSYPKFVVSKVTCGYTNADGWDTGYTISAITTETGLTGIVSPAVFDAKLYMDNFKAQTTTFGVNTVTETRVNETLVTTLSGNTVTQVLTRAGLSAITKTTVFNANGSITETVV